MSKGAGEDGASAAAEKAETDSTASNGKRIVTPHVSGMSGVQSHSHVSWSTLRTRLLNAKISEALSNLKYVVNENEYRTLRCIGSGGYSKVYEVYNENKELFALKVVHMAEVSDGFQEELLKEINFLERFKGSDHVIEMIEYEYRKTEEEHVLLVLMERGECDLSYVLSRLQQKERLTPSKLRFFWEQMLEAVQTIHNENVVHADLKPGNFLLVKGHLKLIDFGLAAVLAPGKHTIQRSFIGGTRDYISPESLACYIFEDGVINYSEMRERKCMVTVGYKSDIWALGVILYQLTYGGIAPFSTVPGGKLAKIQATVSPDIPVDFYPVADPHLMDTLNLCLTKDPDKRADVDQLLAHPFLNPF
jgi:serine/threonine-protein kinase TTK/MPS1